jgi:uncharacterized protein
MTKALIIFIKNALPGKVKTRLASTIGDEKAVHIYRSLLAYTNTVTKNVDADRYVYYDLFINEKDKWDAAWFSKKLQEGNDLGDRMSNSFKDLFFAGYENIVIVGSDCPAITAGIVEQAFAGLKNTDVVIGPSTDGGYYLLGLKKLYPALFMDTAWSTDKVLEQTLETCKRLNLSTCLLAELSDIDNEDDLNRSVHLLTL